MQPSHPLSSPSPPALSLSQHRCLFPMSPLFASGGQSIGVSASTSVLQMNTQASGSITSWQIDGETVETVIDFIFVGSKITADGDCSREIKRCLLLGRKAMTNLDSILKSRDITLPTKVLSSQRYGFSSSHVWMWELHHKES